jgi:hypothetical protein
MARRLPFVELDSTMPANKFVAHNDSSGILRNEIVSGDDTNGAASDIDRAAALIGLADNTTDDKEAAALLELAAEQIELAERKIAPQQQPKKD